MIPEGDDVTVVLRGYDEGALAVRGGAMSIPMRMLAFLNSAMRMSRVSAEPL